MHREVNSTSKVTQLINDGAGIMTQATGLRSLERSVWYGKYIFLGEILEKWLANIALI